MSVKVMGIVFDAELPRDEKFVLISYTDHADHAGRNIYPSVATMARKTGYGERSIQTITKSLTMPREEVKLGKRTWPPRDAILIDDGRGPNGTNRWRADLKALKKLHPADSAPPQKTAETPADSAPKPLLTVLKVINDREIFQKETKDVMEFAKQNLTGGIPKRTLEQLCDEIVLWGEHLQELPDNHPDIDIHGETAVYYACVITVENISQFKMPYIQAVLNGWMERGFMSPKPSRRSHNGKQPQTEWDEDEMEATRQSARERIKLAKEK